MSKLKLYCLLSCALLTMVGCKQSTPKTEASASDVASSAASTSPLESFTKVQTTPAGTSNAVALAPDMPIPTPPVLDAASYVVMDFASGKILAEYNSDAKRDPASLTKLMTSYISFDALRLGKLKLTDLVTVSEHAWREGGAGTDGSTSFLPINSQATVETLLLGMIVQSGNDASIALAEHIAGNEDTFAQLMRAYAQRLGMTNSSFGNATGLPSPLDYTTAHDMALLAQALIRDFPQYYHYFSVKEYTFNNTTQHNRNGLLNRDPSVDGLKTGHTSAAGYCLVTSAKRNDMRLVTVVMGMKSMKDREDGTSALLNYGFSFYETKNIYTARQPLKTTTVRKGQLDSVQIGPMTAVQVSVQRGRADALEARIELPSVLIAPLQQDTTVGQLKLTLDGQELASYPLYPLQDVAAAGWFGRTIDSIKLWFE
ncbi:MAG: D-alanyl-D-alanine carboxypeptidase family protein [Steroidobacteraceae bacterium]